jgi:hypothetical protein
MERGFRRRWTRSRGGGSLNPAAEAESNVPTLQLRYLLRSCRRGRRQAVIHAERVRVGHVVHVFEAIFPEARNHRRVTLR